MVVGVGDNSKIRSRVLVEYLPCGRICRVVRPAHTQVWAGRWRRVLINVGRLLGKRAPCITKILDVLDIFLGLRLTGEDCQGLEHSIVHISEKWV